MGQMVDVRMAQSIVHTLIVTSIAIYKDMTMKNTPESVFQLLPRICPWLLVVFAALSPLYTTDATAASEKKTRVIATTDGEVDDRCSMVRFHLYANEWDIQGIIHSSSKFHWKGDENHKENGWADVVWLDKQIDAYEAVYPNLKQHDATFPTPDYLRSQVFVGNIGYEGDMDKETPGSNRIVEVLLEQDDSPIWLQAWGGSNTIARALKTIKEKHPERVAEVTKTARLYLIAEQDKTLRQYIIPEWPGLEVLLSDWPAFEVIAYPWKKYLSEEQQSYFGEPWMTANILDGHGPLAGMYEAKKRRFHSEGDTPSYLHVIRTGLLSDAHPTYGGWGGRFKRDGDIWLSVDERGKPVHSIARWTIDFQNDWAARADWCVKNFEEANHAPTVILAHDRMLSAKAGASVPVDAGRSTDPDGDSLSYQWWHYGAAGTVTQPATIDNATSAAATVHVPEAAKSGETLHLVCTVRDGGTPTLTRYARVIVTVK